MVAVNGYDIMLLNYMVRFFISIIWFNCLNSDILIINRIN